MTTQTQYPSMDDAHLAHQARADPEAFAEADDARIRRAVQVNGGGQRLRKSCLSPIEAEGIAV